MTKLSIAATVIFFFLIVGCATLVFRDVGIDSRTAEEVHIVPQDVWRNLGNSDPARLERMTRVAAYQPLPTNARYPLEIGEPYYFIPVCNGRPNWQNKVYRTAAEGLRVEVTC